MAPPNPYTGGSSGGAGLGRGGRRPNRPNRGAGGGGGGGSGGSRVPKGGLYGGKAGEAAANQDPMRFFQAVLRRAGLSQGTGSGFDQYVDEALLNDFLARYNAGVAGNQRMSPVDWLKAQYGGAGFKGNKGRAFNAGTLLRDNPGIQQGYETYYANTNPLSYITTQALEGGVLPQAANPEFSQWFTQFEAPRLESLYETEQVNAPGTNVSDWLPGQLAGVDQRFQTYRSNTDPAGWAIAQALGRGDTPANGNAAATDYYRNVYAPEVAARFQAARTNNANLNFDQFFAGIDPNEWRRAFANRAPQFRQPSRYAPGGGRFSWWQ